MSHNRLLTIVPGNGPAIGGRSWDGDKGATGKTVHDVAAGISQEGVCIDISTESFNRTIDEGLKTRCTIQSEDVVNRVAGLSDMHDELLVEIARGGVQLDRRGCGSLESECFSSARDKSAGELRVVAVMAWSATLILDISATGRIASPVDTDVDELCSCLATSRVCQTASAEGQQLSDGDVELHCACVFDKARKLTIGMSYAVLVEKCAVQEEFMSNAPGDCLQEKPPGDGDRYLEYTDE